MGQQSNRAGSAVKKRVIGASFDLTALSREPPTEFIIFPFGTFRARWMDGSEHVGLLDADAAQKVMANFAELGHDLSIDYNHRSLEGVDDHTGRAAGSFELEVRDTGIWATNVQWTETAADYIRKREYRYTSPVWNHDENGRPLEIFNLALTPNPAMLGYQPLVASAQPPPEEGKMLEKLRRQLGLSESATEEEILAKLASLQGAATQMASLAAMTSRTDPAEVVGVVQASLQSAAKVKTLEAENADLKRKVSESEITALVEEGEAQGKLTPAMASAIKGDDEGFAWAREPKALRAYLQVASAVVPMGEHQPDTTKIQTASILTAEDRQVAKQFGISEEDFAKQKGLSHAQ